MSGLRFLQLLHLADSALPVGAAARSFGLESLVSENKLEVRDLFDFFRGYLQEAGRVEAVFVYAGYDARSPQQWQQLNDQMSAMKAARETREASLRLGKRFAALAAEAFAIEALFTAGLVHLPLIFGHVAVAFAAPAEEVAAAYLHQSVSGLVSACQRLLPLGNRAQPLCSGGSSRLCSKQWRSPAKTQVDDVELSQPLLARACSRARRNVSARPLTSLAR